MENEMVERVARAIDPDAYIAAGFQGGDAAWGSAKARARAAIKAMREPTEDMRQALHREALEVVRETVPDVAELQFFNPQEVDGVISRYWRAMINAAIA